MSPRNHFSSKYGPYFISDRDRAFRAHPSNNKKPNFFKALMNRLRKFVLGFGLKK